MDQAKQQTKGNRLKVLGRLLKVVLTTSPWMLIVSVITIILAAGSAVIGSLFIERLIDTYVTPLLHEKVPNYGPLLNAILVMFGIYAIGFISNYLFSMLMGVLAQKFNSGFVMRHLPTWNLCRLLTLIKIIMVIS